MLQIESRVSPASAGEGFRVLARQGERPGPVPGPEEAPKEQPCSPPERGEVPPSPAPTPCGAALPLCVSGLLKERVATFPPSYNHSPPQMTKTRCDRCFEPPQHIRPLFAQIYHRDERETFRYVRLHAFLFKIAIYNEECTHKHIQNPQQLVFPHVFTVRERAAGFLPSPRCAHAHTHTYEQAHIRTHTPAYTHTYTPAHPVLSLPAAPCSPAPGVSVFSLRAPSREDR